MPAFYLLPFLPPVFLALVLIAVFYNDDRSAF